MAKTAPGARLYRSWQRVRIHHYVLRHDDCTTPALRAQLLARGHDPQLVEQVLGERARAPSKWVPLLLGFGSVLLINLLVYIYYRDYWLETFMAEWLAVGGLFVAGSDPMVEARWSWSPRAEDLSEGAQVQRRQERGMVHRLAYGIAAGALVSGVVILLV